MECEVIANYVGNGLSKLVQRSISDAPHICVNEALKIMIHFYQEHLTDATTLYTGVFDGLTKLKENGHLLAVLTNKAESLTKLILEHLGIYELFDFIIGDGSNFPLKPDPTSLKYIIEKSGLNRNACWMIGDHHTDMAVANSAEIKTIFCEYGIGVTGEFAPTLKIKEFSELTELFNKGV